MSDVTEFRLYSSECMVIWCLKCFISTGVTSVTRIVLLKWYGSPVKMAQSCSRSLVNCPVILPKKLGINPTQNFFFFSLSQPTLLLLGPLCFYNSECMAACIAAWTCCRALFCFSPHSTLATFYVI